jgi:hypothetical protein
MRDVTRILSQIESGDPSAAEQLLPVEEAADALAWPGQRRTGTGASPERGYIANSRGTHRGNQGNNSYHPVRQIAGRCRMDG